MNIGIRHLVVEGSSQWLLGLNVTRACNHLHINDNRLQFPTTSDGKQDHLSMMGSETHNYVLLNLFLDLKSEKSSKFRDLVCLLGIITSQKVSSDQCKKNMNELSRVVNRVHNHVCGYETY